MYEEFFGLREKPFNLTPSSRFLYLGEIHKEALAFLTYGVTERAGFILLTGEVGTGKTTMVRALLQNLSRNLKYVHLSNPLLSPQDFLRYIAISVFTRKILFKSKADFLFAFEAFLQRCLREQTNFILIIDEAHKLSFELLEEIRLLSNMEEGENKLINIILIGQPELNTKLSEPRCRPLLQRISIRHHVEPLNLEETRDYITTRLEVAGAKGIDHIFSKSATNAIYEYSKGYPRMINILSDNALLLGYSKEKRKITHTMVKECFNDLQLKNSPLQNQPGSSTGSDTKEMEHARRGRGKWAAGLLLVLLTLLTVGALGLYGKGFMERSARSMRWLYNYTLEKIAEKAGSQGNGIRRKITNLDDESPTATEKPPAVETEQPIDTEDKKLNTIPPGTTKEQENAGTFTLAPEQIEEKQSPLQEKDDRHVEKWVVVKEGDTLTSLALSVYGRSDDGILDLIHSHNPEIKDINWIDVGQKIFFPPFSGPKAESTYTVHIASYEHLDPAYEMVNRLAAEGYEVFMLPTYNSQGVKIFRVTLGSFNNFKEAHDFNATVLEQGVSDYANVIPLEMK